MKVAALKGVRPDRITHAQLEAGRQELREECQRQNRQVFGRIITMSMSEVAATLFHMGQIDVYPAPTERAADQAAQARVIGRVTTEEGPLVEQLELVCPQHAGGDEGPVTVGVAIVAAETGIAEQARDVRVAGDHYDSVVLLFGDRLLVEQPPVERIWVRPEVLPVERRRGWGERCRRGRDCHRTTSTYVIR